MYYRAAALGVGGKSAPWAAATCHWIRSQRQIGLPGASCGREFLLARLQQFCTRSANESTDLRMSTPVCSKLRPREFWYEAFARKPRHRGYWQRKQTISPRKEEQGLLHTLCTCGADASEVEPKSKWFVPRCSYDSSSGPAAGVRFQLMLFDVSLEFSRTFNHAVDQYLAIRPG
jgi:hypothetical protein